MTRPRVAVVYARDDAVLGGGADTRVDALLAALRQDTDVALCLISSTERHAPRRVRAALSGLPPRMSQQFDRSTAHALEPRLRAADVVVAATTFSLAYVPRELLARTALDAHNVESRVVDQLARHDPSLARRYAYRLTGEWTRQWERRAARALGQIWAVSEDEAEWFRSAGARDVQLVPNGVYVPTDLPPPGPDVLLVASFESVFNAQGLAWFRSEVWPLVRAAAPQARLVLVGRGSEDLASDGVEALGFVDDLHAVYARARLAIAPLRSGAGTRLKVLEGMAHGVPVVSTRLGAEGLELAKGEDFLEADSPDDFARCCIDLLCDDGLHHRIREHGRKAVQERYAWPAIGAAASAALLRLASTSEPQHANRLDEH